jgi:hypothetical protein
VDAKGREPGVRQGHPADQAAGGGGAGAHQAGGGLHNQLACCGFSQGCNLVLNLCRVSVFQSWATELMKRGSDAMKR